MKKQRLIGSKWHDSKGRTWEVLEMVKPGLYQVGVMLATPSGGRIAVRQGYMYAAAIRESIARAEALPHRYVATNKR